MTESAFSKLFYEILLRLNFEMYSQIIYKCFEESLLFINCHLKNIEVPMYGKFRIIQERRLLGVEAVIHIHSQSKNKQVKSSSRQLIFDILRIEMESGKLIDKIAFEDVISPCKEIIEKFYEELASEPDKIDVIKDAFLLLKDVMSYLGGSQNTKPGSQISPAAFDVGSG